MKSLYLNERLLCDLECLLNGSFHPLTGFLNADDYQSVLHDCRLSDGALWPIPITCPVTKDYIDVSKLALLDTFHRTIAYLHVESIYQPNIDEECQCVFGTTDTRHPYVSFLKSLPRDTYYLGGRIEQVDTILHADFRHLRMTPQEVRDTFHQRGWNQVVAFQTRNPMHRCHYELTRYACRQVGPDATLLIHPIVGMTQDTDIAYTTRVKCYQHLLKQYPDHHVLLSLLVLSMRMAGPREALWHALIRANYGCSYLIIGRDHAGPSTQTKDGSPFYKPYEAQAFVQSYEQELPITMIPSQMLVYVKSLNTYMPINDVSTDAEIEHISGTELRHRLRHGIDIPAWFTFPDIAQELQRMQCHGQCIYLVGLSGAGKSTIAILLKQRLEEMQHRPVTLLDGDLVRTHLSKELGFSKQDRSMNVRRIGYVASEIVKHNGLVIVANIAPYEEDRTANRHMIQHYGQYIEVFVDTPFEVCEQRDPKGLYAKARMGEIQDFTGIDDIFEPPQHSDIHLHDHHHESPLVNVDIIIDFFYKNQIII